MSAANYSSNSKNKNRYGLVQLVRFLMVKLIQLILNPRFNMSVAFMANHSFSERRRPRQQRDILNNQFFKS
jgi:hypothetical protein